jgi:hypothetical protein
MAMPSFSVLQVPDEIWCQIFAHLQGVLGDKEWHVYGSQADTSGFASLISLCLTCRRLRLLAQPLLYRTVLLEGSDEDDARFEMFGSALLSNPQLGSNIRTFTAMDKEFRSENLYEIASDRLNLQPRLVEICRYNGANRWACSNAAYCLAFMPNLELLDLTRGSYPMLPWMLSGRLDM